jgi:hypothetical protein
MLTGKRQAAQSDGRVGRGIRSKEAIVDALFDLIDTVSVRSERHYGDMDGMKS